MKVLLIHRSSYARGGGGAIAMYRLHTGLRKAGVDSKILCHLRTVERSDIIRFSCPKALQVLEPWLKKVTQRLGLNDIHAVSSFSIKGHKAYLDADVVNFHGLHGGFFSYLALPTLTRSKPAVFTLHDMWAYTGHCAISYGCDRWRVGCGQCPYLDSYPPIRRDNTRLEWKLKNWIYSHSHLTIVTLSSRQTAQVKQSMLNRFPIHQIPHGVDTEIYEPLDPEQCRTLLGIPPNRKVLMFAALRLNQFNKGGDLLLEALQGLPESLKAETVLLTLGNGGEALGQVADIQTYDLGYISHDRIKAIAYSAADLFVFPTRAESFGLVLLESMACATPVVSFGVGGTVDLVRPGVTGYLAKPEDAKDLREGIVQLIEDESRRRRMGQQGREMVLREYRLELQVQRYIALYNQLLQGDSDPRKNDSTPKPGYGGELEDAT